MTTSIFQLIDLDRTLFDTTLFVKMICDQVDVFQPGLGAEIDVRFEEAYRQENTFFALAYIREKLGEEQYNAFVDAVMRQNSAETFLLPGVRERLEFAQQLSEASGAGENSGFGLFTYSQYPEDQYLKTRLTGLDTLPMYIGNTADKTERIKSWQTSEGKFQLPNEFGGVVVDVVTLEDDKLRAFENLPKNAYGFWLTHYEDAEERLKAAGYRNVTIVRDLHESIAALKKRLYT